MLTSPAPGCWGVFAGSPPSPPRSQISHAILTEADWCAIRAVARCELGHLPVIKTTEAGARVTCHWLELGTLGLARETTLRSDGPRRYNCVYGEDGLLPVSLSRQQPFHSSPIFGSVVSPGANHAMKERGAGRQMRVSPS